jgi:hypothetical protein
MKALIVLKSGQLNL